MHQGAKKLNFWMSFIVIMGRSEELPKRFEAQFVVPIFFLQFIKKRNYLELFKHEFREEGALVILLAN